MHGGVIHCLGKLQIPQEGQLVQFGMDLLCERVIVFKSWALHGEIDGCRRAEAHHLTDDVSGFKGDLHLRKRSPKGRTKCARAASSRLMFSFSATRTTASCG